MIDLREKVRALVGSNLPPDLLVELIVDAAKSALGRSPAAERQARYRDKHRNESITAVTADVTPTVTTPPSRTNENREIPPVSGAIAVVSTPMGGGGVSVSESALVLSPSPGSDLLTKPSEDRRINGRRKQLDKPLHPGWEWFFANYPRREAWQDAAKAWDQMKPPLDLVMPALEWRREWWRARGTESEHIPLPASWLRGKRWLDERPSAPGGGPPAPSAREQKIAEAFAANREVAMRFAK